MSIENNCDEVLNVKVDLPFIDGFEPGHNFDPSDYDLEPRERMGLFYFELDDEQDGVIDILVDDQPVSIAFTAKKIISIDWLGPTEALLILLIILESLFLLFFKFLEHHKKRH